MPGEASGQYLPDSLPSHYPVAHNPLHPPSGSVLKLICELALVIDAQLQCSRLSLFRHLQQDLPRHVRQNGLVAYGFEDVKKAVEASAVELLVISDAVVRSPQGDQLLQQAELFQSDFIIINSMHDAGKKLDGLGGIAALLRFKI